MTTLMQRQIDDHIAMATYVRDNLLEQTEAIARRLHAAFEAGGRLFTFGNGGSAADAQHFAAELVGRFRRERRPLPATALSTDTSALTCIGNDYDFRDVFSRQVQGLVTAKDVAFGISTSGESENVVRGLHAAQKLGAHTVALTGRDGGRVALAAKQALIVPSELTARTQETHILLIHLICERLDDLVLGTNS